MALTLKKEDGSGFSDSNSYASVADGDAYHDGHLYASAWTGAGVQNQAAALVMASRVIDAQVQFRGIRAVGGQALQWPRAGCRDEDGGSLTWQGYFVAVDAVPAVIVQATCELARELLAVDRTGARAGEGLKYSNVGTTQTGYDPKDRRPILPELVQSMLGKFGSVVSGGSGSVRLVRV
jgi:hypothetical protein